MAQAHLEKTAELSQGLWHRVSGEETTDRHVYCLLTSAALLGPVTASV